VLQGNQVHFSKQLLLVAACREIVKRVDMWGVDMLFVVGGNGGNAGANAIQQVWRAAAGPISDTCCCVGVLPANHYTCRPDVRVLPEAAVHAGI
jgi:hypothetical protein